MFSTERGVIAEESIRVSLASRQTSRHHQARPILSGTVSAIFRSKTSAACDYTAAPCLGGLGCSCQNTDMNYLLRVLVTAASFWVAVWLLPGMEIMTDNGTPDTGETIIALLIVSVVFGLVNAIVRPIVSLLSLPITCLTLGLFTLIINAAMLALTEWLTSFFPMYVAIDSFFWTAILGALIISIVSTIMNWLVASVTS